MNVTEAFPTLSWNDDAIGDFFVNRFGGGRREWVDAGLRVLRVDGTRGPTKSWVRYWAACRARASELLGRRARIGIDFALSEVVHCKSKGERSAKLAVTKRAARTCADRYLKSVVAASSARVVVSMGGIADKELRRIFLIPDGVRLSEEKEVMDVARLFVFLDHPAGPGKYKRFASAMSQREIGAAADRRPLTKTSHSRRRTGTASIDFLLSRAAPPASVRVIVVATTDGDSSQPSASSP